MTINQGFLISRPLQTAHMKRGYNLRLPQTLLESRPCLCETQSSPLAFDGQGGVSNLTIWGK